MDLKECREQIDEIDEQVVSLIGRRTRISEEVARIKMDSGRRVLDRKREKEKIDRLSSLALSDFDRRAVTELYEQIMAISRRRQYQLMGEADELRGGSFYPVDTLLRGGLRVACLSAAGEEDHLTAEEGGAAGEEERAFAEGDSAAARSFFGADVDVIPCDSGRDVLSCIEEGAADYAVLPLETSAAGIIAKSYDLLLSYDYYIVGAVTLHAGPGVSGADTGAAAGAHAGAVSGAAAGAGSVRYAIVSSRKIFLRDARQISIVTEINDESGALYRALSHFIYNNLNLTKIESRPVPGRPSTYRFFIDLEGNLQEPTVRGALLGLRDETGGLKILGNYSCCQENAGCAQLRLLLQ